MRPAAVVFFTAAAAGLVAALLAPHTNGPRDVPRYGALSLIQKPLHYRGIQQNLLLG